MIQVQQLWENEYYTAVVGQLHTFSNTTEVSKIEIEESCKSLIENPLVFAYSSPIAKEKEIIKIMQTLQKILLLICVPTWRFIKFFL